MDDDELKAFIERLSEQYAALLRWASNRLGNVEDAEDVLQDALLKAFLDISRHREKHIKNPPGWLHRILVNACNDFWRRKMRGVQTTSLSDLEDVNDPADANDPIMEVLQDDPDGQYHEKIQDAIAELPERYREVARLHYIEGLKQSEIFARFPHDPRETVRSWIKRARKRLYKILKRHLEEGED
jgi:RNA polymerase sigma-70 factor (ECF subfamily)